MGSINIFKPPSTFLTPRIETRANWREASMLLQSFTHPPCCSYLVRLVLHKMKFWFFLARERESWKVFWVPPFLFVPLFLSFVTHLNSLAARNKDETRRGANSAKQITSSSWRNEGEQGDQKCWPKFWKVWPKSSSLYCLAENGYRHLLLKISNVQFDINAPIGQNLT